MQHYILHTEIIQSPQDTNVFLDELGLFICETYGDYSGWKVNGSSYTTLPQEIHDDIRTDQKGIGANEILKLNITARALYNGTTIQCVTGQLGGSTVGSEVVTLMIQGINLPDT